ncbi:MAG: hypothetical protein HZC47_09820 [Methanobacterium sp.]|uniref:hypothetical protein n=1 Tax=Methanobacterium sp. TaxID=2164 RepID=UPI003D64BD71|nr:hypothetical protein [Methanobacterium sp.]
MKKIAILFVIVMVLGVLSTSGCIEADKMNTIYPIFKDSNITAEYAEDIAYTHVRHRIAEANSQTLTNQIRRSWLSKPVLNGNIYTISVHVPGVGAMVPDFDVYIDKYNGNVTDNLPSNWAATAKSNFD